MKRVLSEITGLMWTLAGTALVLITLSGETRIWGWYISLTALGATILVALLKKEE